MPAIAAEDDPGGDAKAVRGEGESRGVLLVVAGELARLEEGRHPGERVAGEEDVLVRAGRAAVVMDDPMTTGFYRVALRNTAKSPDS